MHFKLIITGGVWNSLRVEERYTYILWPSQRTERTYKTYIASTLEDKAEVLNSYAMKHLDMTADAKVSDSLDYLPNYSYSPLATRYCATCDKEKDVTQLAQDCMMHQCNRYCLKSVKLGTPRTCRSHYGTESQFGKVDTPGMELIQKATIVYDRKGISHFKMRRTHSVGLVQHSKFLLLKS